MKIKRRTVTAVVFWLKAVGASAFLFVILYTYFGTQIFTVTSFSFSGIAKEDVPKIEDAIKKEYSKKELYFFPSNKVLTPPVSRITKDIKEILPNTDIVRIHASGLHTLTIEVIPYTPVFRLLDGGAVDARGIIYKEQHDISSLPLLTYATGTVDALFLENIGSFITKVGTMVFPVTRISIDSMQDVYLYGDQASSTVIVEKNADFKKAWSTLVSALDTNPLKTMMAKDRKNLEYIDLRFGNKVFYKFTNAVPVSIISSHNATTTPTTPVQ